MPTLAILVDWYGPFASVEDAQNASADWNAAEVLYLATGKRKYQLATEPQYVGISNDVGNRFNDRNHKISTSVANNLGIWLGFVVSYQKSGRNAEGTPVAHSTAVRHAEWMIAYFMAMPLNVKNRARPPPASAVLVNRWFKSDGETRRVKRGHPEWPDFVEFDAEGRRASLVWFGQPRRITYSAADIRALAKGKT